MSKGKIYLIPTHLGEFNENYISPLTYSAIKEIQVFIIENIKSARRFLRKLDKDYPIDEKTFFEINKRTSSDELQSFVKKYSSDIIGVISEAGCPGIADPGANTISFAHEYGMKVIPISGPSSIYMALMASGKNGQNFKFNGYISKEKGSRKKEIEQYEVQSLKGTTQIFMDTPFRNNHVLEEILSTCKPNTTLCVACDVSLQTEYIQTKSIQDWKKTKIDLNKRPCIFII